jgi:hypothetical protein
MKYCEITADKLSVARLGVGHRSLPLCPFAGLMLAAVFEPRQCRPQKPGQRTKEGASQDRGTRRTSRSQQSPVYHLPHSAQTNANAIANATANIHRQSFANGFSQRFSFFIPDDNTDSDADNGRHRGALRRRQGHRQRR